MFLIKNFLCPGKLMNFLRRKTDLFINFQLDFVALNPFQRLIIEKIIIIKLHNFTLQTISQLTLLLKCCVIEISRL